MKLFYKQAAALLAIAFALTGCEESGTMDANVVGVPTIEAPKVTAAAIQDGVKLEWNAVIDAETGYSPAYTIFRRETAGGADVQVSPSPSSSSTDPATGKYVWRDLQKDAPDSVKAGTKYTYTVVAGTNSFKNNARTAVEVTTLATFLAKGTKLEPPQAVTLELLSESNTIKVIVTPSAAHKDVVGSYSVTIYKDGAYYSGISLPTINYPQTTAVQTQDLSTLSDGKYTATVTANPPAGNFYLASDPKESAAVRFESLFGPSSSIYASPSGVVTAADGVSATGFSASISISGLKQGVTYSVERASATVSGTVTGAYAAVVLSKYSSTDADYVDATPADLTPDHLGTLGASLYDRTLQAGSYKYRLKAVKDTAPQYKESSSAVTFDPTQLASQRINIRVAAKDTTDPAVAKYAVTPSLYYKDLLPADGKLVIYWLKGDSNSYQNGKYSGKIEFSKDELEAAAAKSIDVPNSAAGSYVFAQAWLEFADGTKKNVSQYNWTTGNGVSSSDSYYSSSAGTYVYYAQFN